MIYLLRHAETEWNFQLRKQGLDDSPLTGKGIEQAEAYGKSLQTLLNKSDIDEGNVVLHASPLGRTRVTAQFLIDALDVPNQHIHYEPRLIEFDYGRWSGLTNEEIEAQYPGELESRERDKWNYTVPDGESYADVEQKVAAWMSELPSDKVVLVVTHSVVSRVIRAMYLNLQKHNAGMLEHPQNTIFRLIEGQIDTICVCQ